MEAIMNWKVGQIVGAYTVERIEALVECGGEARVLRHRKTGSRVLHIANDDDNTVFCVALRTPPENSTGLPHILEHSVLCGSERFPPKKPFVHLLKTSLNTFLNAMTFSDKTIYPVASRNPQDFRNLVSVYLDAVFFPKITRETFLQEGWHFHAEKTSDSLSYKGVVYNEMRGVYSNPESVLAQKVQSALLKGTPYEFDSGGDPRCIPQLTYDDFKDFHKRYYHPSNAWTVLYGKIDTEDYLAFMDDRVFSKFEKADARSEISTVDPLPAGTVLKEHYSLGENDSTTDKTYLGKAWYVGDVTDVETAYGLDILYSVLLGSDASPLRQALVSSGLGQDAYAYYSNDQRDGVLYAGVSGSNPEKEAELHALINRTLREVLKSGFQPRLVESVLTRMEFRLREADFGSYPKGLIYAIESYATWLYKDEPLTRLAWEKPFFEMKQKIQNERFLEKLLEERILNNGHTIDVVFAPEVGLSAKREQEHAREMEKEKSALSQADFEKIVSQTQALLVYQGAEDSSEDMATLPVLKLSEVRRNAECIAYETRQIGGAPTNFVPSSLSGIGYLQMGFDVSGLPLSDASWISLLTSIFTSLGTKNFSYTDLVQELGIRSGGTGASVSAMGKAGIVGAVNPILSVGTKFLSHKAKSVLELLLEMCVSQDFSNKVRLRELLAAEMATVTGIVQERGSRLAMLRGFASVSPRGRYAEHLEGVDYVRFIKNLCDAGDAGLEKAQKELQRVASNVFTKNTLRGVCFSGAENDWQMFAPAFGDFVKGLPTLENLVPQVYSERSPRHSAIVVPSQVQYVGLADIAGENARERGLIDFLGHVLRSGFLWDEVRVKGGAYGCMVGYIPEISEFALVSYRDPNLKRTLGVYREIPHYLRDFSLSQESLDELKIGYFGGVDKPLTPQQRNRDVWRDVLMGVDRLEVQRARDAVLDASVADIQGLSEIFAKFAAEGSVAVVGGAAKVKQECDVFSNIDEVVL
jgi:Zn-dependent M16 (insulinase) family peptidase